MGWFTRGLGNGAPPPGNVGRPLMPARLINLLVNPFARAMYAGQTEPQSAVYLWGGKTVLDHGLEGNGPPQWPMIEFTNPALGSLKTGRSRILLPEGFVLLSYWASSTNGNNNSHGGFRVSVYDVNRRMTLTIRPIDFNTLAGNGTAPLFLRRPYPFGFSVNGSPPQAKITIVNLENVANTIQFGFYGIVAPGYQQP